MFDNNNDDEFFSSDFQKELDEFERMYLSKEYSFLDSDSIESILDHLILLNQLDKAKWAVEQALKHFPFNNNLIIKHAQILLASGKVNQSLKILLDLERVDGQNSDLQLALALNYSQLKNRDLAIKYFRKAFEMASGEEKMEIAIDLALELENKNAYQEAIEILNEVFQNGYSNDLLIYELAHCYEKIGNFDKAEECFLNYIDEEPYSYTTWYNLGNIYLKKEDFPQAIWAYEYAILINDSFIPAMYNLANVYFEENDIEKSLEYFQKCLEFDHEDPIVYCSMGECFEELGEFETAYEMYSKSTELMPQFADAWLGRGIISDLLNHSMRAVNEIKNAIRLDDTRGEFWRALGNVYERGLEQHELALEAYEKALKLSPDEVDVIVDYLTFLGEVSLETMESAIMTNTHLHGKSATMLAEFYSYWMNQRQMQAMLILEELMAKDPKSAKKLFFYFPELKSDEILKDRLNEFNENLGSNV